MNNIVLTFENECKISNIDLENKINDSLSKIISLNKGFQLFDIKQSLSTDSNGQLNISSLTIGCLNSSLTPEESKNYKVFLVHNAENLSSNIDKQINSKLEFIKNNFSNGSIIDIKYNIEQNMGQGIFRSALIIVEYDL